MDRSLLIFIEMSMSSFGSQYTKETGDIVQLSEGDAKRYEALFGSSVMHYSHLQLNESIGEGS